MNTETMEMSCIGSGVRHTASVGSVALSQATAKFFASVSQDSCLKFWSLPKKISTTGECLEFLKKKNYIPKIFIDFHVNRKYTHEIHVQLI